MAKRRRKGTRRKSASDALAHIRQVTTNKNNVWEIQKFLRGRGYFARAVSANKVVTTAPTNVIGSAR